MNKTIHAISVASRLIGVSAESILAHCTKGVIKPFLETNGRWMLSLADIEAAKKYQQSRKRAPKVVENQ